MDLTRGGGLADRVVREGRSVLEFFVCGCSRGSNRFHVLQIGFEFSLQVENVLLLLFSIMDTFKGLCFLLAEVAG
jgi:hypothetical protein